MSDLLTGPVRPTDAAALARLHRESFPGFFLSQLGEPLLREFYLGFVDDPSAISVVARDVDGRPVGAVVGTVEPQGFYKRLLRQRFLGLGLASARAAVRRPRSIGRLVRGARYRGEAGAEGTPEGALLSSICTEPRMQGTGIGRRLVAEWERAAAAKGATLAHLSTDAVENDSANAFYDQCGWRLTAEYRTREGRRMNLYTKELLS